MRQASREVEPSIKSRADTLGSACIYRGWMAASEIVGTSVLPAQPAVVFHWNVKGLDVDRILRAGPDDKLESPVFEALGAKWSLRLYLASPLKQGQQPDSEHMGCFLYVKSGSTSVLSVLKYGSELQCSQRSTSSVLYSAVKPLPAGARVSKGWPRFISHEKLAASPDAYFTPEGVFQLVITLKDASLKAVQSSVEAHAATAPVPPPTLASELRQLLAGTRGSPPDVQLLCSDGQLVPAHSFVLGLRSGVFAAQLSADGPLAPVDRDRVPVPPEITAGTLRRLLEFVYTDELTPASAEEAQHLLNAADHYALPRLLAICERTLEQQLSVDNAAFTLTLAAQHRARALERAAVFFAARRIAAVMRTDGWAHLSAARPLLKDKLLLVAATGELPPDEEEQVGQGGATAEEGAAVGASAGAGGSGGEGEGARNSKRPRVG